MSKSSANQGDANQAPLASRSGFSGSQAGEFSRQWELSRRAGNRPRARPRNQPTIVSIASVRPMVGWYEPCPCTPHGCDIAESMRHPVTHQPDNDSHLCPARGRCSAPVAGSSRPRVRPAAVSLDRRLSDHAPADAPGDAGHSHRARHGDQPRSREQFQ